MRIRINLLNKKGGVIYSHYCKNNNTRITINASVKAGIRLDGLCIRTPNTRLQNMILPGVDFKKAVLLGVDFQKSYLSGENFSDARLKKVLFCRANLRSTNFSGADLLFADFRGADITGANFKGARLRGAYMDNIDFDFGGVDISNVIFGKKVEVD